MERATKDEIPLDEAELATMGSRIAKPERRWRKNEPER